MYHLTKFFCLNEPIYVLKNVLRKTEFTKLYQFNIGTYPSSPIRKTMRAANPFIKFHNLVKRNKLQSLQLNFLLLIHGMKLKT